MRLSRTGKLLATSFAALILLAVVSTLAFQKYSTAVTQRAELTHREFLERDDALDDVTGELLALGIEVRDMLSTDDPREGRSRAATVEDTRRQLQDALRRLRASYDAPPSHELQAAVERYLRLSDQVLLARTESERRDALRLLRGTGGKLRDDALDATEGIRSQNVAAIQASQASLQEALQAIERLSLRLSLVWIVACLLVGAAAISRNLQLEQKGDQQRADLQRLSLELVHVQEAERKGLSRELHDEIGQVLTALRMEVGNAQSLLDQGSTANPHLTAAAGLVEQTLRSVRDLARGLRPSMLDELGLAPAITWQAREFSRHTNLAVNLSLDDSLPALDEPVRTCLYRFAQEALTNCARHSQASRVDLSLKQLNGKLSMSVLDDGRGFDMAHEKPKGIGLLGIKERVMELGGSLSIESSPGKGTKIAVEIPIMGAA